MSTDLTRRALMVGGLAAVAGAGAWWLSGRRTFRGYEGVLALARSLDLPAPAAELGSAYLALHPEEADAERLIELLFGAGGDPDTAAARSRLAERIGRDWIELDTVQLDGWIVARSDGRFLALATLLPDTGAP